MNDKVCPRCGGQVSKMEIKEKSCFTNHKEIKTMEQVCKTCSRVTNWTVSPALYGDAKHFVENVLGEHLPDETRIEFRADIDFAANKKYSYYKKVEEACRCLEFAKEKHDEAVKELLEMVPQVRNEEDAPFKGSVADNRYVTGWNDAALYFKHIITMNL